MKTTTNASTILRLVQRAVLLSKETAQLLWATRRLQRYAPAYLWRAVPDLMLRRIRRLWRILIDYRHRNDDFYWPEYTRLYYRTEHEHSESKRTLSLREGDCLFEGGRLVMQRDVKPMHPVVVTTYEAILRLSPMSVLEVGCGAGDHLHNLRLLNPELQLSGCDISNTQLDYARERYPSLDAPMTLCDITLPKHRLGLPSADVVFTMTVLMHIQTRSGSKKALANLLALANRQVILMENWSRHDFANDIRSLVQARMVPWEAIYLYYHVRAGTDTPCAMIISKDRLMQFQELTDYRVMGFV